MYLLMAISILTLALLAMAVRGRSGEVEDPATAAELLTEVDIEAFRNLIDPREDEFLRVRLCAHDYRRVQRARALAIADYLHKVAANASVMLRVGESVRDCADPVLASMGAEIASSALNVRVKCLLALGKAYTAAVFPGVSISVATVADRYDRLAMRLYAVRHSWAAQASPALSR